MAVTRSSPRPCARMTSATFSIPPSPTSVDGFGRLALTRPMTLSSSSVGRLSMTNQPMSSNTLAAWLPPAPDRPVTRTTLDISALPGLALRSRAPCLQVLVDAEPELPRAGRERAQAATERIVLGSGGDGTLGELLDARPEIGHLVGDGALELLDAARDVGARRHVDRAGLHASDLLVDGEDLGARRLDLGEHRREVGGELTHLTRRRAARRELADAVDAGGEGLEAVAQPAH